MRKLIGKICLYFVAMSLVFSYIQVNAESTTPFEGAGTEENPYLIETSNDLVKLSELTNVVGSQYVDKYYKITADIDMAGIDFEGLCSNETEGVNGRDSSKPQFTGKIDGDYHIISNMTVDKSDNWYGENGGMYPALICWANKGAEIKNLGLVNVTAKGYSGAGGFIGRTLGEAKIENCFVRGIALNSEKSSGNGAMICEDKGSTVRNSYSTDVSGNTPYTGVIGHGTVGIAENVYTVITGLGVTGTNVLRIQSNTTTDEISAFVQAANGAFVTDANNINKGYPVLLWEKDILPPPAVNEVFASGIGDGSESAPYEISTAEDLVKLSKLTNVVNSAYADKHYKLICDIDMSGVKFGGICKQDADDSSGRDATKPVFTGVIDGDGYVISNIEIDRSDSWYGVNGGSYAGLICWAGKGAIIKNLGVENVKSNAYSGAGVFIGRCLGEARVENCYAKDVTLSSFNGYNTAGIMAQGTTGVAVKNCYVLSVSGGMGAIGHTTNGDTSGTVENFYCSDVSVRFKMDDVINGYRWDSLSTDTEAQRALLITASDGVFKADTNNINGGYPVLKWQTERISETGKLIIKEMMISSSESVEFEIKNCNKEPLSAFIAVAAYGENNKMLAVKIYEEKEFESGDKFDDDFSYADKGEVVSVRVILWNSLSELKLYNYADIQIPNE